MAKYAVTNSQGGTQQATGASYKTQVSITGAAAARRAFVYDINLGQDGTPADAAVVWKVDRQTSVQTNTTVAGAPVDGADAAASVQLHVNNTSEPTVTAATQLLEVPINVRAAYRWIAYPGGELVVPATSNAGIGVRAKSASYTGTVLASVHFWE